MHLVADPGTRRTLADVQLGRMSAARCCAYVCVEYMVAVATKYWTIPGLELVLGDPGRRLHVVSLQLLDLISLEYFKEGMTPS